MARTSDSSSLQLLGNFIGCSVFMKAQIIRFKNKQGVDQKHPTHKCDPRQKTMNNTNTWVYLLTQVVILSTPCKESCESFTFDFFVFNVNGETTSDNVRLRFGTESNANISMFIVLY